MFCFLMCDRRAWACVGSDSDEVCCRSSERCQRRRGKHEPGGRPRPLVQSPSRPRRRPVGKGCCESTRCEQVNENACNTAQCAYSSTASATALGPRLPFPPLHLLLFRLLIDDKHLDALEFLPEYSREIIHGPYLGPPMSGEETRDPALRGVHRSQRTGLTREVDDLLWVDRLMRRERLSGRERTVDHAGFERVHAGDVPRRRIRILFDRGGRTDGLQPVEFVVNPIDPGAERDEALPR